MVFKAKIGCCCCCKKKSVPFMKSFTMMCIVLSAVKTLVYLLMTMAHSGPLRFALFLGFALNVGILVISSVLRCRAKNPNYTKIKRLSVILLALLCVEIFITFVGVIMAGFSLNMHHHRRHPRYDDIVDYHGDDDMKYDKKRHHEDNYEEKEFMRNDEYDYDDDDYEYRSFDFGNFISALISLFSFLVFFGLLVWQIFASCSMVKLAKYELENGDSGEAESTESSDEEEVQAPRKKAKNKARKMKKSFKDAQSIEFVEKPKKSRKMANPQNNYVEFEDVRETPGRN